VTNTSLTPVPLSNQPFGQQWRTWFRT